jgi:urease accessory protein
MVLIESLPASPPDVSGKQPDPLILTSEQRRWPRARFQTQSGLELALALPSGARLEPGQVLCSGPVSYVIVEAAPEPVLAVTPRSHADALRIAFEVGNRHFPLALDGENLLVPDDPAMTQLLTRLGVSFTRALLPFLPLSHPHSHAH